MIRFPTDDAIVAMIHQIGGERGYDPDILPDVAQRLTPAGATDADRTAITAAVRRVWDARFAIAGAV